MTTVLSKSKYLAGLQCPKLLWFHYNAKEQIPEFDAGTQARFDQGHEVGKLAQRMFPGGTEVPWDSGLANTIKQSIALLPERKPIYEASFSAGGIYARADILNPVAGDKWDIVEVKSTTDVKDVHCHDLAAQRFCYEGTGVSVRRCCLMHINNKYVRDGAVDPAGFFIVKDVTSKVDEYGRGIATRIGEMMKTIGQKQCPEVEIGPHCTDPYACPLISVCWAKVHAQANNIFTLYSVGKKAWPLYRQGVIANDQIPTSFRLSSRQQIQVEAERSGQAHVDCGAVRHFLSTLVRPLYFLDFETFGPAIPLLNKSRPYRQVPFQFSLHVSPSLDSEPQHHSWLWDGNGDPRQLMLEALSRLMGDKGSIIAYNAAFEKARLRDAVALFLAYRDWLKGITPRIVDLMAPFKAFCVYCPSQHGSASMKAVLPALTGKGYEGLVISDGGTASAEFLRAMFTDVSAEERARVRRNLGEYCGLDTSGMIDIIRAMEQPLRG